MATISSIKPSDLAAIAQLSIETPRDYALFACVSRSWNTCAKSTELNMRFSDKMITVYTRPDGVSKTTYFKKLNAFFITGVAVAGGHILRKDLFSIVTDLAAGNGYRPRTDFALSPGKSLSPLAYLKILEKHGDLEKCFGAAFYAIYEKRRREHSDDPQLQNPNFGRLAFYDEEGCSSTGDDKAVAFRAIFPNLFKELFSEMFPPPAPFPLSGEGPFEIVAQFAIETPKEFACFTRVCSEWNKLSNSSQTPLPALSPKQIKLACPIPPWVASEQEYFQKVNRFMHQGIRIGSGYARYHWGYQIPGKNIFRFIRILGKDLGHVAQKKYSMAIEYKLDEYRPGWIETKPLYHALQEASGDTPKKLVLSEQSSEIDISPLDYFKLTSKLELTSRGYASFKDKFDSVYSTMYEIRKQTKPEDPQLQNPRFGEFAFYDEEGCNSTGMEKALAVFEALIRKPLMHY